MTCPYKEICIEYGRWTICEFREPTECREYIRITNTRNYCWKCGVVLEGFYTGVLRTLKKLCPACVMERAKNGVSV